MIIDPVLKQVSSGRLGVFDDNRLRPIHRWYPFIEGYSADLVLGLLVDLPDDSIVLDCFAGSGTTLLQAANLGLTSFYCEVNPYLAWVTNAKVNSSRSSVRDGSLSALAKFERYIKSSRSQRVQTSHPLVVADSRRGFFPEGVAAEVVRIMNWIDHNLDGPVADLAKLACTSSLIPSSNMVRRTDLRRRNAHDAPPKDLRNMVCDKIEMIRSDCNSDAVKIDVGTTRVATDVRRLESFGQPVDITVTSAPYLNGTNYCRNTKLEMLALGLIQSESELSVVRSESITAGINNVSRRRHLPSEIPEVESIAHELDKVAYDARIPTLVRSYFSDMEIGLQRVRNVTRSGGRYLLDIGDSRFAGVNVPTDSLLSGIAENNGWRSVSERLIRTRRSYDGTELRQVLLEFEAV